MGRGDEPSFELMCAADWLKISNLLMFLLFYRALIGRFLKHWGGFLSTPRFRIND